MLPGYEDVNMGNFDISEEKSASISRNFDRLRMQVRREGLMEGSVLFYIRKVIEKSSLSLGRVVALSKEVPAVAYTRFQLPDSDIPSKPTKPAVAPGLIN